MHWVVGAGGLLGSAVVDRLRTDGEPVLAAPRIGWGTPAASGDLRTALELLISASDGDHWQIEWCAGVGVTGTGAEALRTEVMTFQSLLGALSALPPEVRAGGSLVVASSAGGVYGGSQGAPFTEPSAVAPLGFYGAAKLAIEEAARDFSSGSGIPTLVGRISNLYGPGQSLSKPQGLISHLCLASARRKPLSIYVPLDTRRDYLYVDDAAGLLVSAGRRIRTNDETPFHLKIIASGRSVSIGGLLAEFRRVIGHRPEIVMATSAQAALQSVDLRMQSSYWTDLDRRPTTNLADGMARTLQEVRRSCFVAAA